jgi:hypothetical protein
MMSFVLLWSAICRRAQRTIHAWQVVIVGMMLCLTIAAGCDVRPFSELFGDESAEETDTGDDQVDTPTEPLELTPNPARIETPENTPRTIEVTIDNRE